MSRLNKKDNSMANKLEVLEEIGGSAEVNKKEAETGQNQLEMNPFLLALCQLSEQQQKEAEEEGKGKKGREGTEHNFPPPDSPTRGEQHQLCLIACAPSNAHLSDFEDAEEEGFCASASGGGPSRRTSRDANFPYSSGSSPVSSFRLAIRQSRAPSTCGKFNESLLGGGNATALKSSLCVCTSIRDDRHREADAGDGEAATAAAAPKFPLKERPVTAEYKISHEIVGIGESGKVMACYHKRSGEKCALKVLRDNARSRRELELHWQVAKHPNVVCIGDMFENTFDGLKCLLVVVEFMGGGDLLTIFETNGRLAYSEKCVARIVRQIGSAVQYLHDRNIAHRDIKLENILCSSTMVENCTFKLADFGFAKRAEPNLMMESPCCTPAYVCPEILSRKQYDKSCDIWALGVATYILLCGYPPFYSMQGLPFSPGMRERITKGLFAFPADEWEEISMSTKKTIGAMLKTDPTERITIEQLMDSVLLRPPGHPPSSALLLPPVNSESSLSDGGFESAAETAKMSSAESGSDSHPECESGAEAEGANAKRRAHFFVGSGAKSSLGGMPRPTMPKERVYSIQEEVGHALAIMRMGGECRAVLKDLKTVAGGGNSLMERRRKSRAGQGK